MHFQVRGRRFIGGIGIVADVGPVRGAHFDQCRSGLPQDIRDAKPATNLDRLAA
jgi:hypothetical protein